MHCLVCHTLMTRHWRRHRFGLRDSVVVVDRLECKWKGSRAAAILFNDVPSRAELSPTLPGPKGREEGEKLGKRQERGETKPGRFCLLSLLHPNPSFNPIQSVGESWDCSSWSGWWPVVSQGLPPIKAISRSLTSMHLSGPRHEGVLSVDIKSQRSGNRKSRHFGLRFCLLLIKLPTVNSQPTCHSTLYTCALCCRCNWTATTSTLRRCSATAGLARAIKSVTQGRCQSRRWQRRNHIYWEKRRQGHKSRNSKWLFESRRSVKPIRPDHLNLWPKVAEKSIGFDQEERKVRRQKW